jgi:hypothetical protein
METFLGAEFVYKTTNASVAGKDVMVILLQGGSGYGKAGGQTSRVIGRLEYLNLVAGFDKTISRRHSRYPGADDPDFHTMPSFSVFSLGFQTI